VTSAAVDHPRGHYRNPMSDAEVEAKFRTLAGRMLEGKRIDRLLETAWRIDTAPSVAALMDAMCVD